jgi:hypothetical protein
MTEPAAHDDRAARAGAWLIALAMCAWSAWSRWRYLDASPYPLGVDGYFYAGQLRALLEHGGLQWPASPLAFWLMAPLAALTDPIVGAKLGAALLGAAAGVPAYLLGRRLGGSRAAGLLACAVVTASAGSFYLSVEFVKQGVGVTVALTALVAIARALEAPGRTRLAVAAAAVIATAATHKLAAGLVAVIAVPAVLVELRARGRLDARHLRPVALVGAGLVAVAIVLGALFPQRFLAARDLQLAGRVLGGPARWSLPALDLGDHLLWIGHDAVIAAAAALALIGAVVAVRRASTVRPAERALALAFAGLALIIALPWLDVGDPQGLGFRLRLVAFVPAGLAAAAALGALAAYVPARARDPMLAAFAAVWFLAQPPTRDEGVVRAHPAMIAAIRALDGVVPHGDVVIATERHVAFMTAWYVRVPVALDPASVPRARRWRLLTLYFVGDGSPLDRALEAARAQPHLIPPRGLHARHPDGLVLVAEPTWDWVLAQLPVKSRAWAQAWHTI